MEDMFGGRGDVLGMDEWSENGLVGVEDKTVVRNLDDFDQAPRTT
jgi:hypothetical protein